MSRKKILLFSDLEGTILNDNGDFSDQDMLNFLSKLANLQSLLKAEVNIHLLSPIYEKDMKIIIDKIDSVIRQFNRNNKENRLSSIEGAAAYPEDSYIGETTLDRIIPLPKPKNARDFDTASYGKYTYVSDLIEAYNENHTELPLIIYCGNGRNDFRAMKYIQDQKNGFILCPSNSRKDDQNIATYTSSNSDLQGITDGIQYLINEIEKRIKIPVQNKDSHDDFER